jgi:hypothetical protein
MIFFLMRVRIVAIVRPVDTAAKSAEVLGIVVRRVVVPYLEAPIVDEVIFRRCAAIDDELREISLVDADFSPREILRINPAMPFRSVITRYN